MADGSIDVKRYELPKASPAGIRIRKVCVSACAQKTPDLRYDVHFSNDA